MNLLFVANFAANTGYAWDTIERVFRRVGEQLVRDGHTVTIAYASMADGPSRPMQGAPFKFIEFAFDRTASLAGARAFVNVIRDHRIDALYLTDRPTASWQYPLYRAAGIKTLIVHDRTSGHRSNRSRVHWWLKLAAQRSRLFAADCCIAISKFVRDRLVKVAGVAPQHAHLVYNGIDVELFTGADRDLLRRELGLPNGTQIVFCSGRAQEYKGIHVVIAAAAQLQSRGRTNVAFVYCGDGPYLKALQERATARGLDNFFFLGKRTDVPQLLQSATVAVVPSLWAEAFGLTVVESMAAGVPVVATRTGGIPELISDGAGILIDPDNAGDLAAAIERLLDDPSLRESLSVQGRALARARFSLEVCANNLYAVVSRELSQSPRAYTSAHQPALTASASR